MRATGRTSAFVNWIARHPVAAFFVGAYAFTWLWWLPSMLGFEGVAVSAAMFVGGFGPAVAGAAVIRLTGGSARQWFRRLLRWRVSIRARAEGRRLSKRLQLLGNLFVIGLLRSPGHRLLSRSLLLISYRGRRSGRRFTVPVMYAEREGALTIFVGHAERKNWWRNLREGAEVEVRLRGERLRGQAALADGAGVADAYLERYPRALAAVEATAEPIFVRVVALEPS